MSRYVVKIAFEEGFKSKMYQCTEGKNTIGIGFNLDAIEMPKSVAYFWAQLIVDDLVEDLHEEDWFGPLDYNRRVVVVDMAYQLGLNGMLKFNRMITALKNQAWKTASNELLDSKYARQTPARANRNAQILLTGEMK